MCNRYCIRKLNYCLLTQDEKFLESVKLTERVKLWDKYCGPVNQDAVKVQFLKKIHRQNPPFRVKVKHPREHTIKVSTAPREHTIKVSTAPPRTHHQG